MKKKITLRVNGENHEVEIEPNRTLLEVLRESLGMKGTKEMCNKADCGSCTVLLDGKSVLSCSMLAIEAQGRDITTIEGLEGDHYQLNPIQQAFVDHGATQCGFCTPGMIMSAEALLRRNPNPTKDEIRDGISGNMCRCTGYVSIIDAIDAAAKARGGER